MLPRTQNGRNRPWSAGWILLPCRPVGTALQCPCCGRVLDRPSAALQALVWPVREMMPI